MNRARKIVATLLWATTATAQTPSTWETFERATLEKSRQERVEGISYIAGGALTLLGGFVGSFQSQDAAESLTYTVFQNVGIASVGYGYFRWRIGDEDRRFYQVVKETGLSLADRQALVGRYGLMRQQAKNEERVMRAILHGLLAMTNLVAGARESTPTVRNGLYFLGAINLFACVGYSFDF